MFIYFDVMINSKLLLMQKKIDCVSLTVVAT